MFRFDDSDAERSIQLHTLRTMRRGGLAALFFSAVAVLMLALYALVHPGSYLGGLPLAFGCVGVLQSLLFYLAVRREDENAVRRAVIMLLPLGLLPTIMILGAEQAIPGTSAMLINSPPSFIYFFLIVITGFAFDARLSVWTGVVAGVGHFLIYLSARTYLLQLGDPAPGVPLGFALSNPGNYVVKSFFMAATGVLVGILSEKARELVLRIAHEEQEKRFVANTFGMLVDPRVRELIACGRITLEGELRVNTVLFSDIRGFSTFSEKMTPQDLVSFMREYFDVLNDEIRGQDGVVLEYVGDEIMALFGAPLPVEDHPERACRAALHMQKALEAQRRQWESQELPMARCGIGIHTGSMLVGGIGSSGQCKYGVVGDSVNLASRLQGLTKDYGVKIIASEDTIRAVQGRFQVRELDCLTVRGRESLVRVYEILGTADDELPPAVAELVALYEEALRLHRQGDSGQALVRFERCLELAPDDKPSSLFVKRLAGAAKA